MSLTVHVHLFAWWLKVYVCGFYTHTYIYWSGTRQASQLGEIEELRQVWKLHFLFVESGSKKLKALTVTNCVRTEGFEANIKQLRSTPPVRPIFFLPPPPPPSNPLNLPFPFICTRNTPTSRSESCYCPSAPHRWIGIKLLPKVKQVVIILCPLRVACSR